MLPQQIIIKPVVSEKSFDKAKELNQYTFIVHREADKSKIRRAVEEIFGVEVKKVRTVNVRGKRVQWGRNRVRGKRSDRKKAVVTLQEKDKIDLFEAK